MAEIPPAAAVQPAKAPRKKSAAKSTKTGSSVGELVVKVVSASKERSGVSLAALKKALAVGGYDVEKNNSRVKIAIKSLVTKGTLIQTKGTGASGSFKLNTKQAETKKPETKAATKGKKPAAVAKKPKTAEAKTAAKKSPKKAKKPVATAAIKATKSPTKVKKSAAPKKAVKSPKKATKSPMKAKAAKTKTTKPKAAKPKKAAPKNK